MRDLAALGTLNDVGATPALRIDGNPFVAQVEVADGCTSLDIVFEASLDNTHFFPLLNGNSGVFTLKGTGSYSFYFYAPIAFIRFRVLAYDADPFSVTTYLYAIVPFSFASQTVSMIDGQSLLLAGAPTCLIIGPGTESPLPAAVSFFNLKYVETNYWENGYATLD